MACSVELSLIIRAHKWRKAWVAPTGSQPEASYKICRYVKVGKDDKVRYPPQLLYHANKQDVEDGTNGDEEDEEEGEGEGEGDGEEEEEEDGDEEEGDEKVVATPAVDTPAGTEPVPGESTAPTPAAPAPSSDPAVESKVPTPIAPPLSDPLPESTPPTLPTESTESTAEHTAIPSNAIELTNTAPDHVADGSTTTATGGIELSQSHDQASSSVEPAVTAVGSLGQNEEKMEVDSPVIEKGVAIQEDAGLVMGEMTPPVDQKELELEKRELDTVKETESTPVGQVTEEEKPEEIKVDEKTEEVAAEQPPALK